MVHNNGAGDRTNRETVCADAESVRVNAGSVSANGARTCTTCQQRGYCQLKQINAGLLLPPLANGKYDVSRELDAAPSTLRETPLLKAA
jgi:hypothetical protein